MGNRDEISLRIGVIPSFITGGGPGCIDLISPKASSILPTAVGSSWAPSRGAKNMVFFCATKTVNGFGRRPAGFTPNEMGHPKGW